MNIAGASHRSHYNKQDQQKLNQKDMTPCILGTTPVHMRFETYAIIMGMSLMMWETL